MKFILGIGALAAFSQAANISIASSGGNTTSRMQYGIMFEDISYSGEGGIYAELIRNRAFQLPNLTAWSAVGGAQLTTHNLSSPLSSALPTSLKVAASKDCSSKIGIANTGWWGIDVQVQPYNGSFYVLGGYSGNFTVSLQSNLTNDTYGSVQVESKSVPGEWTQHTYTLTPEVAAPNVNNTLMITFDASKANDTTLDFNLISLFPPTYNDRPNGLRKDLMEAIGALQPKFFRLPGGNNIEGEYVGDEWVWNATIGDLRDRVGRPGDWSYWNTNGLGLIEYLLWAQDLGMEPILAVFGGHWLDGSSASRDNITLYVESAMAELEFLLGDTNTTWGAAREGLGYPEPFDIKYVEIGNEDNLSSGEGSYVGWRFEAFYEAINAKYPDITVIASTVEISLPDSAAGDYHQYTNPDTFVSQYNFFDQNTSDHKTMAGEYAIVWYNQEDGNNTVPWGSPFRMHPWWSGSVSEAVFTLGTERNADKMIGASYAPALQNMNEWQWSPNMITFTADPSQTTLSTSWHVIRLLSTNLITDTLPVTMDADFGPLYHVAGKNVDDGTFIFKTAVYNSTGDYPVEVKFDGVDEGTTANLTVLTGADAYASNSVGGEEVVNTTSVILTAGADGAFVYSLPDLSVAVLRTLPAKTASTVTSAKRGGKI